MNASTLLPLFLKASLLLSLAWLAAFSLRRASAAARHQIWLAAFAALLLLPILSVCTPRWTPSTPAAAPPVQAVARTVLTITAGADEDSASTAIWLWRIYAAGALFLLGRTLFSQARATLTVRRASLLRRFQGVDVRCAPSISMPMVCGLIRPAILLSPEASNWPPERLRVVLTHEAAHARRLDTITLFLGALACALYWPLPWIWAASRKLALEAEFACDDLVLASVDRASDYAAHLIEIVRGLSGRAPIPQGGIPMAHASQLEHRLRAMLSPNSNRRPAGVRFFLGVSAAALALLLPLAALHTPLLAFGDGLSGIVRDPSGAAVAQARITIQFTNSARKEVVRTNDAGEFTAAPLPDGDYIVIVEKPGFAALRLSAVPVGPGQSGRLDLILQTGSIKESITVSDKVSADPSAPQRLRVGGNMQAAKLISKAKPVYPMDCKAEGVQGTVMLRAVISKEGSILSLEPINQLVDKRLVQNAIDAVRQWKYSPTLLNGQPVEIVTEIEVNYTLLP